MNVIMPDEAQNKALLRLKTKDKDAFASFREMLCFILSEIDQSSRFGEGPELHRNQGRAQVIAELIDCFDSCEPALGLK